MRVAILLITLLLLGCTSQQPPAPKNQTGGSQTGTVPKSNEAVVQINGFKFSPSEVEVTAGTKVVWVNNDPVSHTVTLDNGEFDTGSFPHGDNRSYIFTKAGVYAYHCAIHPSMNGTVTVR